jgi:hypothetical protein
MWNKGTDLFEIDISRWVYVDWRIPRSSMPCRMQESETGWHPVPLNVYSNVRNRAEQNTTMEVFAKISNFSTDFQEKSTFLQQERRPACFKGRLSAGNRNYTRILTV